MSSPSSPTATKLDDALYHPGSSEPGHQPDHLQDRINLIHEHIACAGAVAPRSASDAEKQNVANLLSIQGNPSAVADSIIPQSEVSVSPPGLHEMTATSADHQQQQQQAMEAIADQNERGLPEVGNSQEGHLQGGLRGWLAKQKWRAITKLAVKHRKAPASSAEAMEGHIKERIAGKEQKMKKTASCPSEGLENIPKKVKTSKRPPEKLLEENAALRIKVLNARAERDAACSILDRLLSFRPAENSYPQIASPTSSDSANGRNSSSRLSSSSTLQEPPVGYSVVKCFLCDALRLDERGIQASEIFRSVGGLEAGILDGKVLLCPECAVGWN